MSLKYGLLGLLSYGDMTGYELNKTFKDSLSFFWEAQTSQIYRELNAMEEAGWLSSHIEIQTDKPNRRVYSITGAGREILREWLKRDLPTGFYPLRNEILMRIFFSGKNSVEDNIRALKKLETAYLEYLGGLGPVGGIIEQYSPAADSGLDIVCWGLTEKFGAAYYKMCLEWIHNSIEELEQYRKVGGAKE